MDLQQINQRIAVVNAEGKRINNERQVNIGKRQTLEKQLSEALANYKKVYGVELTVGNIEGELARVVAEKEAEVSNIEHVLALIKAGNFEEAQRCVDAPGETKTPAQPSVQGMPMSAEEPVVPVETPNAPVQAPVPPAQTAPVEQMPTPPAAQAPSAPVQPVPPPLVVTPAAPPSFVPPVAPPAPPKVAPKHSQLSGLDVGSVPDEVAPPAPPAPPTPPKAPAPAIGVPPSMGQAPGGSFNAILNGSMFNPGGN